MSVLSRLDDYRGAAHDLGLQVRVARGGSQAAQTCVARPRDPA
jgi:hypothetical protein